MHSVTMKIKHEDCENYSLDAKFCRTYLLMQFLFRFHQTNQMLI